MYRRMVRFDIFIQRDILHRAIKGRGYFRTSQYSIGHVRIDKWNK